MLVPQQQRSRETLGRLLRATVKMLEIHGLRGATIPRIAEEAGVSPASVYRRFEDKEALFRTAFLDMLEYTVHSNRTNLRPEILNGVPIEKAARSVATALLRQYRQAPGLMKALEEFLEEQKDDQFKKRAVERIAQNFERLANLLLVYRDTIAHPDPDRAVRFALLQAATSLEVITLGGDTMWNHVLPLSDDELVDELSRSLLGYLRCP